jgi:hypothetical protein
MSVAEGSLRDQPCTLVLGSAQSLLCALYVLGIYSISTFAQPILEKESGSGAFPPATLR